MMSTSSYQQIEEAMNVPNKAVRLAATKLMGELIKQGSITRKESREVNNHVHTTYSFIPYEPAMAAYKAWEAGLQIVGSIDHDSIAAAEEMTSAGKLIGIATTVGFEVRCSFLDTSLADKKINNPDSKGIVYMCVHGVPGNKIEAVRAFLKPIHAVRNIRNREEVQKLNDLIKNTGLTPLDFDADVVPLSRAAEEGSITERHILAAFAKRIMDEKGVGAGTVHFLKEVLNVALTQKLESLLLDTGNPHYVYDLLGVLKGNYLPQFFVQPSPEETIPVQEVVDFGLSIGAIPAYAYLGDISESPTGDKKAEHFEDSYLEELFDLLAEIGFPAVTYMPPRNTKEQLLRVQKLARERGLMEISGVDINSSRQVFACPELLEPEFEHLIDSAWALVAHERLATAKPELGLFHPDNPMAHKALSERIAYYAELGRNMNVFEPDAILENMENKEFGS